MSDDACPLPRELDDGDRAAVERMLDCRRIAVVGLSDRPDRPSYEVSEYLQRHGYEIVPVNPKIGQVLGAKSAKSLAEVGRPIDVALVFRKSEDCEQVTREAIAAGAKGVWLQAGIRNESARKLAAEAGVDFVQDRCMMVMHMRRAGR